MFKLFFSLAAVFIACNHKFQTVAKPAVQGFPIESPDDDQSLGEVLKEVQSEDPPVLYPEDDQTLETFKKKLQSQHPPILYPVEDERSLEALKKRLQSQDPPVLYPDGDDQSLEKADDEKTLQKEESDVLASFKADEEDSINKTRREYKEKYFMKLLQRRQLSPKQDETQRLLQLADDDAPKVHVRLRSEGCAAEDKEAPPEFECGWGFIYVNGKDVSKHQRGHNIAVLSAVTGEVEQVVSFDTHGDSDSGSKMQKFLDDLPERKIVLMVIQDDGSRYDLYAIDAIDRVFGEYDYVPYRGSLAAIGYTGPDEVPWRMSRTGQTRYEAVDVITDIPLEKQTEPETVIIKKQIRVHMVSEYKRCTIEINGKVISQDQPGAHVVIMNLETGELTKQVFDLINRDEGVAMRRLLKNLAPESAVMVATQGDDLDYLSMVARHLKKMGSQRPPNEFGAGYVFLGYHGANGPKDWVQSNISRFWDTTPAYINAVIEVQAEVEMTSSPPIAWPTVVVTNKPTEHTTSQPKPTGSPLPAPGTCGLRQIHTYVIGGENSRPGEWPWQVGMYVQEYFNCGGSLISDRWIITAAHCINSWIDVSDYSIVVGDFDRESDEGTEKTYKVKRIIRNMNFDYDRLDQDIALFELEEPVQFTRYVQPVCLAEADEELPIGSKCYITGWGSYEYMSKGHTILQKALLPPVSDEVCSEKLQKSPIGHSVNLTDDMLCAGVENTILSGCHGDSGGPYVCQMEDGHWVLHGAVSWGSSKCDAKENFSVFAKISSLRDWIDTNIGYEEDDMSV